MKGQPVGVGHAERRALLSLLASTSVFAVMAILVKLAAQDVPATQIAFIRFASGAIVTSLVWLSGRISLRPRRWGWLFMRGLFGGVAVLAYFMCIQHVPVGLATLLNNVAPVFTMMFSWWLLGERPRPGIIAALAITMAGVVLVVGVRVSQFHGGIWELVGLSSAISGGLAVTSIRAARRDVEGETPESAWAVFFWFTVLGTLVTLPFVIPPFGAWVSPTSQGWILLAGIAASGIIGQVVMSHALRHVTGTTSGVVDQLKVVLAGIGGLLLFGDQLPPLALVGSALTMTGVVLTVLLGQRKPNSPSSGLTDELEVQ